MLRISKYMVKRPTSNMVVNKEPTARYFVCGTNLNSRKGGVPGCNLPFRKCMDNPMRFTAFYLLAGVIGFGAPWLVLMHQMLRPYDYVVDQIKIVK